MLNRRHPGSLTSFFTVSALLCLAAHVRVHSAPPLDGFKYNKEVVLNTSTTGANVEHR